MNSAMFKGVGAAGLLVTVFALFLRSIDFGVLGVFMAALGYYFASIATDH